ncbi:hypothetical protein EV379_0573 [Microterricola gilva]|uniref:Uncharacterized protein n=1 Tax=Microterricola gilva TaxID=393267 RepID=A0A4Q8AKC4_9MICO|nr:hypothetical protein EV379_0573 [Microterricola gilva]
MADAGGKTAGMELGYWLAQHNGIAHTRQALAAGFTRYAIRASVDSGVCSRIRRDWLAMSTAPHDVRLAAGLGGRVACLGVAKRLGLWHLDDGLEHVSVARNAVVPASRGVRLHWGEGPIPLTRFALVEPIENALVHIAECQPFENALVVWDSALNQRRVSEAALTRLHLRSAAARAVQAVCSGLADSGLETLPVVRLAASGIHVAQQILLEGTASTDSSGIDSCCRSTASASTPLPSSGAPTSRTIACSRFGATRCSATTTRRSCSSGHASRPKSCALSHSGCISLTPAQGDSAVPGTESAETSLRAREILTNGGAAAGRRRGGGATARRAPRCGGSGCRVRRAAPRTP